MLKICCYTDHCLLLFNSPIFLQLSTVGAHTNGCSSNNHCKLSSLTLSGSRSWTSMEVSNARIRWNVCIKMPNSTLTFHARLFLRRAARESCRRESPSTADELRSASYDSHTSSPTSSECYARSECRGPMLPTSCSTALTHTSVIFVLTYFLVLVLVAVFEIFFSFSFVLVFIIFSF